MGDLVGEAVEGTLYFLPYAEFERIRTLDLPSEKRVRLFADMCRLNALFMIARAGSGHIGSSFSSLDIVSWLLLEEMTAADVYFSSKGHDAPGYYAALIGQGSLDFKFLHALRRLNGLPGHPDVGTPGIVTNTGSLGMGVSKAKGMVLANRQRGLHGRVFVMTGDGELQEGQFWESLVSAVNLGLHEIVVIIDHNKLQSDTFVKQVSDLGDLEAKLGAFGWCVARCDGHDVSALSRTLDATRSDLRPKVIIADTVKGKGVSFMEHTSLDSDVAMYRFHSGAPDADAYRRAAQEIIERLLGLAAMNQLAPFAFETNQRDALAAVADSPQRLVAAYSQALIAVAENCPDIVALDADLVLDTGLIPFRERFPERFIECGIAEQDMVSMAGGMALRGLLPIVHSFACFLSARPNEQIYNNCTEGTRIIYVGSLAGVIPGGPGHSHQAVRDISALAAMPGMILLEPSCEAEVGLLLDWCVKEAKASSYLRLVSLPWAVPFSLPTNYRPCLGRGLEILSGEDGVIVAAGPVLLAAAVNAARIYSARHQRNLRVINLPWLNYVDPDWLRGEVIASRPFVVLNNHYLRGGQSDCIAAALLELRRSDVLFLPMGLSELPPSGSNQEVLKHVGLETEAIVQRIEGLTR